MATGTRTTAIPRNSASDGGIASAGRDGTVTRLRKGTHFFLFDACGQRLTRQGQVNRTGRLAVHDRLSAAHDFLGDHPELSVYSHLTYGLTKLAMSYGLLHEVHVVVARTGQLAAQRVGRLSGHQEHRQPRTEQVVHCVARIRRADIHVHQHRLSAAGHGGVSPRHVHGDVFVRTDHDLQVRASLPPPPRESRRSRRFRSEVHENTPCPSRPGLPRMR